MDFRFLSVHGIFRVRILECVAIFFSIGSSPTQGSNLTTVYFQNFFITQIETLYPLPGTTERFLGFPDGSDGKESICNVGDLGSIPGLGRSPGEGNANPFQYSCLENSMDRGAWQATVYGVTKSQTGLSDFHFQGKISLTQIQMQ